MLAKYNTVLENRNSILKMNEEQRKDFEGMLDIYSEGLATLSADIAQIRIDYTKKLDLHVKKYFEEMTNGKEIPRITYETNADECDFESRDVLKEKYLT